MKRVFVFLLATMIVLCVGGCSTENSATTQTEQPKQLIVFKVDGENVSAFELNIDLNKCSLALSTDAIYKISDSSRLESSRIFPQYMSSSNLVLRETPVNSKYNTVNISSDNKTLYFEEYILQFDNENFSFQISENGESICKDVTLIHNDKKLIPTSFFIDKNGKIAILCMTSASLIDTEMVSVLYAKNGESYSLEKVYEYSTIWEEYDLSKVGCPNYMSNSTNVFPNPAQSTFLYNETSKLMNISPYDGSVACVLDEGNVTSDMPYLDVNREFYSFFSGVGYQDGYYVATFPAFNSLAGTYAVIYSVAGKYMGCVLCESDSITLYNEENKEIVKMEGAFVPQLYIPSYFTN